jgi:hypothetical protein
LYKVVFNVTQKLAKVGCFTHAKIKLQQHIKQVKMSLLEMVNTVGMQGLVLQNLLNPRTNSQWHKSMITLP